MTIPFPSDTIEFGAILTGGNSAGNGAPGTNYGDISNTSTINFNPHNYADGADVHVYTGDHVHQTGDWTAGTATATADPISTADANAESNGGLHSYSGHDTSTVTANTTAYQSNFLALDLSQSVYAGIGGSGGNNNSASGGDVHISEHTPVDLLHV